MFLIDRRNATPDRRQNEMPVWRDRRMSKEEKLYREKVEKEWAASDPTRKEVSNPFDFYIITIWIIATIILVVVSL